MTDHPVRVAVLVSGGGTNLQTLLDALHDSPLARVTRVISNKSDAPALARAQRAGVPTAVLRSADDGAELLAALDDAQLVVLAGYLRLIPPAVVRRFRRRMINIHPALLPDFGGPGMYGRRVHEAVLASGARYLLLHRDQLLLRLKREDWDAVIATNLTATFVLAQAAMKPMIKQRAGRIIAVSSVVGQMGNAGQTNYAASKAGLIGFAKALAREVASRNVTVNVIAPGMIDTDMTRAIGEKAHATWTEQIPLGRLGSADDVAAAACFLASDEAAYITGQVLAVNGGMYM